MIIQILHNKIKGKESKIKIVLSLFLILNSLFIYSQNSLTDSINISEEDSIKFQKSFFNALSEKAILNYKKAIEYLDNCNEILPNEVSVLFELSKNYFKLNRNIEALEFIDLGLKKDSNNIWLLEHKVAILKRVANFDEAIIVQKKIAKSYPKKKQFLVFLHLQNRDVDSAKKVLSELKEAKLLNSRLRFIEEKINKSHRKVTSFKAKTTNTNYKAIFEKEKTYKSLERLLKELIITKSYTSLLKYSEIGLTLFPAQPFVYLTHGKALNKNGHFSKALQTLQNGIDFVIDNNKIEAQFYLEMAASYKGLHDTRRFKLFQNKASKILK